MKNYKKHNRAYYLVALVFVFISNIFAVVLQFFKGDVLDFAIAGEINLTIKYAAILIAFILGEIAFFFAYKQFSARFVVGCTKLLKRDVFDSILRRGFVDYKNIPQGEYIAKYTNEADTIKNRHFQMLPLFWDILSKIIFVSIALFVLDWRIALITIALLTTPLYLPKLIEKQLQKAQAEYLQAVEANLSKVNDWLSGFEIIKNFSVEKKILSSFDASNDITMEKMYRDTSLGNISQLITTLISYLSYFVVLVCATYLVLKGVFSAGNFFVAIGMIDQLSYPLISLAEVIRQLIAIKSSCRSMEDFIGKVKTTECRKPLLGLTDTIRFRNVTFAYPNEMPILRKFDFEAKKGNRYLIQGPSGCGKTTAINLLLHYYDVDEGVIEFDGVPISEYNNTYSCITIVRQEAVLFHDTLRNNLTMYQQIPDEKLIQVLKRLGLEKFANKNELETFIAENGANLSGGEKKRICLARALLRDTDILILDEPLANLDANNVDKIEDLILTIKGKLVIVVSHQFNEAKLLAFDDVLTLNRSNAMVKNIKKH